MNHPIFIAARSPFCFGQTGYESRPFKCSDVEIRQALIHRVQGLTAFKWSLSHPQITSQTERFHRVLEALTCIVNPGNYRSSQNRPNVRIECVSMKFQANGAILLWFNTVECRFNHLADAYVTESESIIEVLLLKHSLIHVPQQGEEETQSKFAMTDSGDGARRVEVERNLRGVPRAYMTCRIFR
ncbi:hypothetical protein EDD22DRAFT_914113 [Suillus occidentalis]|nr:hypothetical protein EDD22DRAFT_914113 [Suillus occidentalis]